jgi:hypothetical protein
LAFFSLPSYILDTLANRKKFKKLVQKTKKVEKISAKDKKRKKISTKSKKKAKVRHRHLSELFTCLYHEN